MIRIYHALPGGYRHVLADLAIEGCDAWDVGLTTEDNNSGQLALTISEDNPEFGVLITMRSEVIVMRGEVELWRGRIVRQESQKPWIKKLVCKGVLDYLYDALLMPQVLSGSAEDVVESILVQFNAKSEAHKHFTVGQIEGIGRIEHEITKPTKAFVVLSELFKEYGGGGFSRRDGDQNLIDWFADDARPRCSQKAIFGENVSDPKISTDGEMITTVLYGYGKNDLTFESANDGKPYVEDAEAIAQFGRIEDSISFSKITSPQELLAATENELNDRLLKVSAIEATAIDLSWLDDSVEPFSAGYLVPLVVPPFGIDELIPIKKIVCPLFSPSKTKIELGTSMKTASAIIAST